MDATVFRLPRLSVAKLDNTSLSALSGNADDKGGGRNSGHRRRQSLMGRNLAQNLLPPGEWRIVAESAGGESAGRPVVLGPDGMPGPDLSISHSGQWVAAAMAQEGRIGIDVETPRAGRNCLGMAQAYFSQAECNVVEAEGQPALLAFWTMREAIAKALGGGLPLALALDGVALLAGRNAGCCGMFQGKSWVAAHLDRGSVHMALAWTMLAPPPVLADLLATAFSECDD